MQFEMLIWHKNDDNECLLAFLFSISNLLFKLCFLLTSFKYMLSKGRFKQCTLQYNLGE